MARPSRSSEIQNALLQVAGAHPRDLVGMVAAQLGLSNARIGTEVRALVADGYLDKVGTTRPSYTLGRNRRFARRYPRAELAEDTVWFADIAPVLRGLPDNILSIGQHGVTEMVNNAVDHSDAARVTVTMDLRENQLLLAVHDDGVGIFRKIARALALPDQRLALLELAKGKFTTDPRRHTGEGVFFTARMFDRFRIASGGLVFDHEPGHGDDVLFNASRASGHGTSVFMAIDTASARTPRDVFSAYSSGPDDYAFTKTIVPVRLAQVGDENLVSRSQAKRLLQRVDRFRRVVLDFAQVETIGQAFADEIFRVFALAHPEVELIPTGASTDVQQMIRRAEVTRDEQNNDQLPLL